jgi:hypothetical protein
MCDPLLVAGIGIALEHASPSSDGFCVVREITSGGLLRLALRGQVERVVSCGRRARHLKTTIVTEK